MKSPKVIAGRNLRLSPFGSLTLQMRKPGSRRGSDVFKAILVTNIESGQNPDENTF